MTCRSLLHQLLLMRSHAITKNTRVWSYGNSVVSEEMLGRSVLFLRRCNNCHPRSLRLLCQDSKTKEYSAKSGLQNHVLVWLQVWIMWNVIIEIIYSSSWPAKTLPLAGVVSLPRLPNVSGIHCEYSCEPQSSHLDYWLLFTLMYCWHTKSKLP